MSIQNLEAFTNAVVDWRILKGCFGAMIEPSDVDGFVERGGHFLYLEAKSPDADLKRGQEIAIRNRVRDGLSTVVVLWGENTADTYDVHRFRVYYPAPFNKAPEDYEIANLDLLRDVCARWYRYANSKQWTESLRKAVADTEVPA